jgi:hypothetical protein
MMAHAVSNIEEGRRAYSVRQLVRRSGGIDQNSSGQGRSFRQMNADFDIAAEGC